MLQLLVGGVVRYQEPMPIPHTHAPDDSAAGDGCVHHRNGIGELALEHTVETWIRWSLGLFTLSELSLSASLSFLPPQDQ